MVFINIMSLDLPSVSAQDILDGAYKKVSETEEKIV